MICKPFSIPFVYIITTLNNTIMKTHWKKLTNPNYLGAYEFQPGEKKILTIESVAYEMLEDVKKKEEAIVVKFSEPVKSMILNSTNCKSISKLASSPYIQDWAGMKIEIYVSKIDAFGEKGIECLRVSPTKIKEVDVSVEVSGIKKTLTIDGLKEFYLSLTPELQRNKQIVAAKNEKYALLSKK